MSVLIVLSVFHTFICLSSTLLASTLFVCVNDCEAHFKQKPDSDMHIKAGVMSLFTEHSPYSDLDKPLALVI